VLARERAFSEFRKDKIAFSKEQYISVVDMADLADKYDAFICGSDMIWSEEFIDSLEVYFLLFAPRSKRISYSPSFGRAILAKENVPAYRQWISEIASLSCREQSGVKLIATLTGKEATHIVDPTLLLSSDEWKEISRRSMKMQTGSPYLLTYLFSDLTNDGKALIKNICDFASLEHRCIPGKFTQYIKEKKFGIIRYGPYEFINIYSNASFIVTSTYHGLVFAIIFNNPFIVLKREDSGKWAKYDDRLVDLLVKLGLEERYVSQKTPFDSKWLTLDYSQVNRTIEQCRSDSVDYLKNALISATNISNTTNVKQIMNLESKNRPIDNYSMEKCVGCGACSQICSVPSISMTANYEGFLYPECDYSICISCGMCNKVCQINYVLKGENKRPKKNLVAISRIKDIWKSAASGGVAGTFAAYAVNNMNALVFGCILNENIVAEHISITKSCENEMIQGSKYVQNNIDNAYKIALIALQHEQNVLFFGTPCQIAGLQNFLGKKYAKLITVDHVCHGVPSPSFLKNALTTMLSKAISNCLSLEARLEFLEVTVSIA